VRSTVARDRFSRRALLARSVGAAAAVAAFRHLPDEAHARAADTEAGDDAIWDAHVHLTGVAGTVEERIDGLLDYAGRLGIERLVVFMGTSFSRDPSPAELRRQNDDVLRAIAHAPDRVLGMVYLNPKHTKASLDELNRCVRDGPMVGIKLWIAMGCRQPELDPLVRRAVELKVPIFQHAYWRVTENLPGESSPVDVAILAARHPDASLVCLHTGNDWERGIRAIRGVKNVWAEISGSDPTAGMVEPWNTKTRIGWGRLSRRRCRQTGAGRLSQTSSFFRGVPYGPTTIPRSSHFRYRPGGRRRARSGGHG
jgi:hypothetical protein